MPTAVRTNCLILVLSLSLMALAVAGAGCDSGGDSPERKPSQAQSQKPSTLRLAERATAQLGSEKVAFLAILRAWEQGYSLKQIVSGIESRSLDQGGAIDGASPKEKARSQRRLLVASLSGKSDQSYLIAASSAELDRAIDEELDFRNHLWTAWLLGVIAHGYSPEQIAEYMLSHSKPAQCGGPGFTPCIYEDVKDPATGKVSEEVAEPALDPEYVVAAPPDTEGYKTVTYAGLAEDFGRDLDALLAGEPNRAESEDDGESGGAGFKASLFSPKLSLMPSNPGKLVSYEITVRISDTGVVEGSYELNTDAQGEIRVESGTFKGQAVLPKQKGGRISLLIDGSETMTATSKVTGIKRTDNDSNVPKMFQGTVTLDGTKGSGLFFARSAMLQWKLGE